MSSPLSALAPSPDELTQAFTGREGLDLLEPVINKIFAGKIALVSSFGAEAAVLLHMVAQIDPATPVLFLDTGRLFAQTLTYQRELSQHLGLRDVRILRPEPDHIAAFDPQQTLAGENPAVCCFMRKVLPLRQGLRGFSAWITGRKNFQTAGRRDLAVFERDGEHVKINPLATWNEGAAQKYLAMHNLPAHPLVAQGYPSIGCMACTTPVRDGEDLRAGRWRGQDKTECGIHFVDGRAVRGPAGAQTSQPGA
ncbi:MAG: phosphoadenylyl-sulfate reductase [Alphaproteobacteria bacterium]